MTTEPEIPREEYDNIFSDAISANSLTTEEAVATVLAAAILVDLTAAHVEVEELIALADRTRTLGKLSEEERRKCCDEALQKVREPTRLYDEVGIACDKLVELDNKPDSANAPSTKGIALSAFAHACDLVFADQNVKDTERKLLIFVADRLKIKPDRAREVINMMQAKNRF